jgi:RHS repeat-associated protein
MGRSKQRDSGTADGFQYDSSDELTRYKQDGTLNGDGTVNASFWNITGLQYDNNGNRTQFNSGGSGSVTYAPNNLNQYDSVSNMGPLGYDGKGNVTSADGWTYSYDAQNRLTTMQGAGLTITKTYDPLNRVITRNVNGAVTQNVWDGWNLIEEHRPDWSIQRCYLYGANQNEMVASFDGNVYGTHWYWQDGRGNTSHITGDDAALFERYTYDLSGAPRFYDPNGSERMVSAYDTRFLFAGSQYLPDTGLYDMRNRFYHIGLNRFLQTDPIGFKGDALNLYRYCGNDDVNRNDPMGLTDVNYVGDSSCQDRELKSYLDDINPTDVISVSAHGSPTQLMTSWGGKGRIPLSIGQVVADIRMRAPEKFGNKDMSIRLYSCRAGDWNTAGKKLCPAQKLANETHHKVQATGADLNPETKRMWGTPFCKDLNWYEFSPDAERPTLIDAPPGYLKGGADTRGLGDGASTPDVRRTYDSFGSTTQAAAGWESSWGDGGWLAADRRR